ncbi:class I SAM-dependent methyltransferase [Gimesia chilikensis]|uniref:Ubiquinone biosynthesis O-methyltransferase n=1 Tax=Gimesia chilikensis TaxID=2605989 RepID=A0A517PHT5_9PLAN|nr:class I SAM-dependent methyltransferase [Gimesia chilikensis]QDT18948.1 Ubiquinone biosynthesis O-methyltransferase [Gimesia chilikensis]
MSNPREEIERFNEERRDYSNRWGAENAPNLVNQDSYSWMASFIESQKNVLDIGCGDGSGIIELAERGHSVISIEENPYCIEQARQNCIKSNIKVNTVLRGEVSLKEGITKVSYSPVGSIAQPLPGEVLIIEGDILNDDVLLHWLMTANLFNAVTCWCIGTYVKRLHSTNGARNYRLYMENAAYNLADKVLLPGGVLHFVHRVFSRGEEFSVDDRNDELRANKEMAEVTSLIVDEDSLIYRDFSLPRNENGIPLSQSMGTNSGASQSSGSKSQLESIQARKP